MIISVSDYVLFKSKIPAATTVFYYVDSFGKWRAGCNVSNIDVLLTQASQPANFLTDFVNAILVDSIGD